MTITEKIDYLLDRLKQTDERKWNPEHDAPHLHREKDGRHAFRDDDIHGAASQHDIHELRDELARLADIVRELAADQLATARRQSAVLNGIDPDI